MVSNGRASDVAGLDQSHFSNRNYATTVGDNFMNQQATQTETIKQIGEYLQIKHQLQVMQEKERALRIALLDELFPSAGEGTHRTEVGDMTIKGVFRNNINIDQKEYALRFDMMTDEEKACFKMKPTLQVGEYKKLHEKMKTHIDDILVITPGMPSIEIILSDGYQEWQEGHEG